MPIKIYNSLAKKIEPFTPIEENHVKMYVCGMTIYDLCHIGHGRMMLSFDIIQRWLKASGLKVTYVRNITDIDDKIIKRAVERNISISQLTDEMILAMNQDTTALGIEPPTHEPRATDYIPEMLSMVGKLYKNGHAYKSTNGDINYSVRSFPNYGKLSGKILDDLRPSGRIEIDDSKEDPLDFVLWKSSKENEPEDVKYESPYGIGRPGWHIECSAMSCAILGETFDIHGGGLDLQFPHHENEIAQSEAVSGKDLAKVWMHNGSLNINGEKMSKSLGNYLTIRDILEKYDGETLRYYMMTVRYRNSFNFSYTALEESRIALRRLYSTMSDYPEINVSDIDWANDYASRFKEAMDHDFNVPESISVLFDLASSINKTKSLDQVILLKSLGNILGILQQSPDYVLKSSTTIDQDLIQKYISDRAAAKSIKDYTKADEIKKELLSMGISIMDKADGTTSWVLK